MVFTLVLWPYRKLPRKVDSCGREEIHRYLCLGRRFAEVIAALLFFTTWVGDAPSKHNNPQCHRDSVGIFLGRSPGVQDSKTAHHCSLDGLGWNCGHPTPLQFYSLGLRPFGAEPIHLFLLDVWCFGKRCYPGNAVVLTHTRENICLEVQEKWGDSHQCLLWAPGWGGRLTIDPTWST